MLKPSEKLGLQSLLNTMEISDLYSLRDTVTKKMLTSTNREETIEVILSCIKEPCDLLNRHKVKRQILFKYLQGLLGYVSPELSKSHLIVKCLEEWNKEKEDNQVQLQSYMDCTDSLIEKQYDYGVEEIMALEFTKWFFPLYNELKDFSTIHFWPDVKLELATDGKELKYVGDKEVVQLLTNIIMVEKFFFQPNDSITGVRCEKEVHGMVRIFVNGTVHRFNNPIGLFESAFGLVRNPAYDDNWKIKWIFFYIKV